MFTRSLYISLALLLLACPALLRAAEPAPKVEVVFVLDTTGSMSGMIQTAKEKIWSIANILISAKPTPQVRIGLIAYRDRGDEYITKQVPLSADIDGIYRSLMDFQANGGGDGPESVNQALHEAVTKMPWDADPQTYRVIFLVGDYPPHMDYPDDVKYPATCKLASERGININTMLCGNEPTAKRIWEEIATLAGSRTFTVAQTGAATPATPYDAGLLALAMDLEGTRIYYGTEKEQAAGAKRADDTAAIYRGSSAATLADRAGFLGTASMALGEGLRDLVDDVAAGKVKVEDVPADRLPSYMQKMTMEERKQYVADLATQRTQIRTEIVNLAAKRQQYLLAELEKAGGKDKSGFDFVIFMAIKEQAGKKQIKY